MLSNIAYMQIHNASHLSALNSLNVTIVVAIREREVDLTAPTYLLSATVNDLGNRTVESAISEV